jgi:hypothetical protein
MQEKRNKYQQRRKPKYQQKAKRQSIGGSRER